jgi:hypothetical protein
VTCRFCVHECVLPVWWVVFVSCVDTVVRLLFGPCFMFLVMKPTGSCRKGLLINHLRSWKNKQRRSSTNVDERLHGALYPIDKRTAGLIPKECASCVHSKRDGDLKMCTKLSKVRLIFRRAVSELRCPSSATWRRPLVITPSSLRGRRGRGRRERRDSAKLDPFSFSQRY